MVQMMNTSLDEDTLLGAPGNAAAFELTEEQERKLLDGDDVLDVLELSADYEDEFRDDINVQKPKSSGMSRPPSFSRKLGHLDSLSFPGPVEEKQEFVVVDEVRGDEDEHPSSNHKSTKADDDADMRSPRHARYTRERSERSGGSTPRSKDDSIVRRDGTGESARGRYAHQHSSWQKRPYYQTHRPAPSNRPGWTPSQGNQRSGNAPVGRGSGYSGSYSGWQQHDKDYPPQSYGHEEATCSRYAARDKSSWYPPHPADTRTMGTVGLIPPAVLLSMNMQKQSLVMNHLKSLSRTWNEEAHHQTQSSWNDEPRQQSQSWNDQPRQQSQSWNDQPRQQSQSWNDQSRQQSQSWNDQPRQQQSQSWNEEDTRERTSRYSDSANTKPWQSSWKPNSWSREQRFRPKWENWDKWKGRKEEASSYRSRYSQYESHQTSQTTDFAEDVQLSAYRGHGSSSTSRPELRSPAKRKEEVKVPEQKTPDASKRKPVEIKQERLSPKARPSIRPSAIVNPLDIKAKRQALMEKQKLVKRLQRRSNPKVTQVKVEKRVKPTVEEPTEEQKKKAAEKGVDVEYLRAVEAREAEMERKRQEIERQKELRRMQQSDERRQNAEKQMALSGVNDIKPAVKIPTRSQPSPVISSGVSTVTRPSAPKNVHSVPMAKATVVQNLGRNVGNMIAANQLRDTLRSRIAAESGNKDTPELKYVMPTLLVSQLPRETGVDDLKSVIALAGTGKIIQTTQDKRKAVVQFSSREVAMDFKKRFDGLKIRGLAIRVVFKS